MANAFRPLEIGDIVPLEDVVDISNDALHEYFKTLPAEVKARQYEAMLKIVYDGTKQLLDQRRILSEPAAEAVSDLTRTFQQSGNWIGSHVVSPK